jgi:hypothetical protein
VRGPGEGPVDFARRVARARPELADPAGRVTRLYVRLRYESAGTPKDVQALRRLIAAFAASRREKPAARGRRPAQRSRGGL